LILGWPALDEGGHPLDPVGGGEQAHFRLHLGFQADRKVGASGRVKPFRGVLGNGASTPGEARRTVPAKERSLMLSARGTRQSERARRAAPLRRRTLQQGAGSGRRCHRIVVSRSSWP
jgi:hypothetical protein